MKNVLNLIKLNQPGAGRVGLADYVSFCKSNGQGSASAVVDFFLPELAFKAQWFMRKHLGGLICKYRGHKIIDESFANGDTGCDDWHCERCELHFYHRYY